ncbi:alpha/beta hydrolase [Caulobacter flavus]|uniref:Alpha/beta hydrolase n=1 Tax=Caulobacter flavus TaxID=1679497 RepID=A0A2N5CNG1_9CAUL|nr:alpha/beta hydrolase [Caulobacter flavus]AYV49522.1 alpha/beta hydrolase [Caulobacter flavus]PLR07969.1 alpha/beta hydrolase [Caulobacter flavus]
MTKLILNRRGLLAATLAFAAAPALASAATATSTTTTTLKVGDRDVELTILRPEAPKGIIIFSHGAGGWPAPYTALFDLWTKAGFMIVAPLHVDSQKHPKRADYDLRAAFPLRLADLAAATDYAEKAAPGLPMASAGHSYGSLMSLIRAGAMEGMIPAQDPRTKAALCFSSPGVIKGLVGPTSYQGVKKPMMMITGDQDVLPGMIADWREHLYPFETSPAGEKYLWVGKGVGHGVAYHPEAPGFGELSALSVAFLKAKVLGDKAAEAVLAAQASTPQADWKTR